MPCASPAFPANLASGLVGYWPFCGDANDESGNGNNGTVNGATLTSDRFGNPNSAYDFDGVDDYCNLNSQLPNIFSVSFWAQIDSFKVYNGIGSELFSTFNQNFLASGFVLRADATPNKIVSGFWNTSGNQIVSRSNVSQYQWNHYLVTYNGSLLKLYFNGAICDSTVGLYVQNNQNVFLAARQIFQGNNPAFFSDCLLDDIGIWNRALNTSEVQQLYNTGIYFQTVTGNCDTLQFNANITGFNPVAYQNQVKVFPNPAKDNLVIDCGTNFNTLSGYRMKILNTVGQSVYNSLITQQVTNIPLTAPTWSAGAYIVQFINPSGTVIEAKQIIIQ